MCELKNQNAKEIPQYKNYKLEIHYKSRWIDWSAAIIWWVGGFIIYISLNLLREILMYIALGKRFNWSWLYKIRVL